MQVSTNESKSIQIISEDIIGNLLDGHVLFAQVLHGLFQRFLRALQHDGERAEVFALNLIDVGKQNAQVHVKQARGLADNGSVDFVSDKRQSQDVFAALAGITL